MSANYIARGRSIPMVAPTGGVVSGGGYLIGATFGVAAASADSGGPFELEVEGVWRLPKVAGTAFAVCDALFWDGAQLVSTDTGGLTRVGIAAEAAGIDDATAAARLNPSF